MPVLHGESMSAHLAQAFQPVWAALDSTVWQTACLSESRTEKGKFVGIGSVSLVRQKGGFRWFSLFR
jgi:hypothetical protein